MNADNICMLRGQVRSFPLYGDNWTRYKPNARGQVRFWLAIARELAGDGLDLVLCAIEPRSVEQLQHYQEQLRGGRSVSLSAIAHSLAEPDHPGESSPGVIFVAESCGFDGGPVTEVHQPHRRHASRGKMAAAGDVEQAQLLEGGS